MDGNGIEGIELAAEKRLAGKPGSRRVMKDRLGRIVEDAWLKEPMNGENITLTIDSRLQNLAYEALGRQVENLKAKGGSIVIADPKTGDILALANYPSLTRTIAARFRAPAFATAPLWTHMNRVRR